MNELLEDYFKHPLLTIFGAIGIVALGLVGIGPARALSRQLTKRADAGAFNAQMQQSSVRRDDEMANSYSILAMRAISERDKAIADMGAMAIAHAQAIHEINNAAQAEIGRVSIATRASVDASELRAQTAEATLRSMTGEISRLEDQIRRQQRRLDLLTGMKEATDTDIGGGG